MDLVESQAIMLIKVTNACKMGCIHCLEDATPAGSYMDLTLFQKALDFTERAECEALKAGIPTMVLLSGGECTDNPEILEMVKQVVDRKWIVMILTHGLWLDNETLRDTLLRDDWKVVIQVTNDARFYPRKPPHFKHPRVHYVNNLTLLSTIGRAAKPNFDPKGLNPRISPSSFNFRSLVRYFNSVPEAIRMLRIRGALGKSGFCSPAVSHDGTVTAGESRFCFPIGTVNSSNEELTHAVLSMGSCNRCGQESPLGPEHRRAIGLP